MNASRKKDREAIAALMIATAADLGATVERRDSERNPGYRGASITLDFALNGVGALMSIDDLHGGHQALIHWYNATARLPAIEGGPRWTPVRDFSPAFNTGVGAFNPRPHHKATSSGSWQWSQLCLDTGFRLARENKALTPAAES